MAGRKYRGTERIELKRHARTKSTYPVHPQDCVDKNLHDMRISEGHSSSQFGFHAENKPRPSSEGACPEDRKAVELPHSPVEERHSKS
jgi:hypothetical protein